LPKRLSADIARQGALAPVITLDFVEAIERSARPMGKLNVVARRRGRISVKAAQ